MSIEAKDFISACILVTLFTIFVIVGQDKEVKPPTMEQCNKLIFAELAMTEPDFNYSTPLPVRKPK